MSNHKLEMYDILNNITPHPKKTRFPYSYWTPDKITDTQNKIRLVFSKNKNFFFRKKRKWVKGGGELYMDGITLVI